MWNRPDNLAFIHLHLFLLQGKSSYSLCWILSLKKARWKSFFINNWREIRCFIYEIYAERNLVVWNPSRCICSNWLYKWMRLWCLVIWSWLVQMLTYLVLQATYFIHHEKKLLNRRMINRLFPTPKLIPFKTMQKAKLPLYKGGSHAGELCALAP